jgi:DNA-binding beta-propeller fold protein YncE
MRAQRLVGAAARAVATLAAAALVVSASGAIAASTAGAQSAGGDGTIYYGTYDKKVLVIDEATMTVRDSMPVSVGIPIGLTLSSDRRKLYAIDAAFESVEIFDLASRKATGRIRLSEGRTHVRMRGFNVDPLDRFAILLVKVATRRADRWEIGKPTLLRYDLAKRTVTDTLAWPDGKEREGAQILFSPDGAFMYFFTDEDVLVYDAQTLKQVDKWDLQRSVDDGLGNWSFGFPESLYDETGFSTGLFRTRDPINNRSLMGVARVDLSRRTVDFYSLGPSEPVGFALAPGRRMAYGLRQQVGNYQIWSYDLENRRVAQRVEFEGRPRMGLTVSTNGSQLYIHTAGATIDIFDAQTLRYVRTATFRADMTDIIVVPK